jgi:hypothetical protein
MTYLCLVCYFQTEDAALFSAHECGKNNDR